MDAGLGFIPQAPLSSSIVTRACVYSNVEKVPCNRSRETRLAFSSNSPKRREKKEIFMCSERGSRKNYTHRSCKHPVRSLLRKLEKEAQSISEPSLEEVGTWVAAAFIVAGQQQPQQPPSSSNVSVRSPTRSPLQMGKLRLRKPSDCSPS